MRLASILESQKIDKLSEEAYKISGDILMESAGLLASYKIRKLFLKKNNQTQKEISEMTQKEIAVFSGKGNNGGDGLVVARHLHSMGVPNIHVYILSDDGSSLFAKQLERLKKLEVKITNFNQKRREEKEFSFTPKDLKNTFLIVDAIFGIGLSRSIEDNFLRQLIDSINASRVFIVSLDTPSGLDCDRGIVRGKAIQARETFTFGLAKPGFFVEEGPHLVGRLHILPIGFPKRVQEKIATSYSLITKKDIQGFLPQRTNRSHKGNYGSCLIAAGRLGFWGSGILATSAAYKMGAGYVIWSSHEEPLQCLKQVPEVLTQNVESTLSYLSDEKDRKLDHEKNGNLSSSVLKKIKAFALGPGLGVNVKTAKLIEVLKERENSGKYVSVLLDADAITTAVRYKLFPLPAHWVLTPHAGELLRILKTKDDKITLEAIEKDRFHFAIRASQISGCSVLFKGFRSVFSQKGHCFIISTGNSALAKAGSGDVLTGMIVGLMAQGLNSFQAVCSATYIHGLIADEWVKKNYGKGSLNPSDVISLLPQYLD